MRTIELVLPIVSSAAQATRLHNYLRGGKWSRNAKLTAQREYEKYVICISEIINKMSQASRFQAAV